MERAMGRDKEISEKTEGAMGRDKEISEKTEGAHKIGEISEYHNGMNEESHRWIKRNKDPKKAIMQEQIKHHYARANYRNERRPQGLYVKQKHVGFVKRRRRL